ncbi:uncharacterized protein [Parasteatoda tepidariorum]|uniref:uncharacterized protein n=1 Tax=Parasteatoda tepidariorum TaxID=114398 RepID=UPI000A2BFD63|nr:uncharacterized protein LOC110283395 [Parasteatoda tepidariorum]
MSFLCRIMLFTAATFLIITCFGLTPAGGSCQSYGHSCLGGHGKRSSAGSVPLPLLWQQILRAREPVPFVDYRIPERDAFDILKGFTDNIKALEEKVDGQN